MSQHRNSRRNPWKTLRRTRRYDNPWISVTESKVVNVAGRKGIYGTVHFKNLAIGIIPIEKNGDTYLVGQHRYPLGQYSWEIPAGGGRIGTSPMSSARRELHEETGLRASSVHKILTMHLSNSVTDEVAHIYLATGLSQENPHPEEDEVLRVIRVSLKKALAWVRTGKITDAMSVAGLLRVVEMVKRTSS